MDDSLEDQYQEEQPSQRLQSPGFLTRMVNKSNSYYNRYQTAREAQKWLAKQGTKKAAEKAAQVAATNAARIAGASAAATIFILLLVLIVIATLIIVFWIFGNNDSSSSSPTPTPTLNPNVTPIAGGGGSVAACFFYNKGRATGFNANPLLAQEIQEISSQIRFAPTEPPVPAQLVMAIMAHEREQLFQTTNNSLITDDYDATISTHGAIGAAQIVPSTFSGAVRWAVENNIPLFAGKNQALTTLGRRGIGETDQYYRITSIKDSIAVASYEILRLKRRYAPTDDWISESVVRSIAGGYQGGEANPIGGCSENNYCEDVWKGVRGCSPTIIAGEGPEKVISLVSALVSACGPYIQSNDRQNNLDCIGHANPPLPASTRIIITNSTVPNKVFQCVGFVQAANNYIQNPEIPYDRMYAKYYADSPVPAGYRFIPRSAETPEPGDTIIWNGTGSGHIAYVVGVSGATITVAEANWCDMSNVDDASHNYGYLGCGKVSVGRHSMTEPILGWLRKNS